MNPSAVDPQERRVTRRLNSPANLRLYCPQLDITRCRPVNLSTRGAFLNLIPEHAYVGRRVQLVFSISEEKTVKLVRVWAVVVHLSSDGIGFGFTHKYASSRSKKNADN